MIHQRTGGVPRQINTLCSRLLLFGFLEERHTLTADAVEKVANDLRQEIAPVTTPPAVASPPAKPEGRDEALSQITRRLDALEDSVHKHERVIKRALEIAASYLKGCGEATGASAAQSGSAITALQRASAAASK